jgi:SAM-dependent methyltransferase
MVPAGRALARPAVSLYARAGLRVGLGYHQRRMAEPPLPAKPAASDSQTLQYRTFTEKRLTGFGSARRGRIEQSRLAILRQAIQPPGDMLEIGPGHGTLAEQAVAAGWRYRALEPSPLLVEVLRAKGLDVTQAFTPPFPSGDGSADVVYADQVLEHMSGIDTARLFTAEALRVLRPGGVFFVVVPDYLKERTFFWDVDYTHNFVTTERRVRQLLYDGGFTVERVVRSIGTATGWRRNALAAAALFINVPGVDALSRATGTAEILFKIRKNLFETLTVVARKPPTTPS